MSNYSGLIKVIDKASSIALICHKSADGDAFGSTTALYKVLKNYGKEPDIYCEGPFNRKLPFIPNANQFKTVAVDKKYDLVIALDSATYSRLGVMCNIFSNAKNTVLIDHHISNETFANISYIKESASATCEFLFEIFSSEEKLKKCMDLEVATSLYCGIITDSGNFNNSNTTANTINCANALVKEFNVDSKQIIQHFMYDTQIDVFKLKIRVLNKLKLNEEKNVGLIYFSLKDFEQTNTSSADTDGIINEVLNITGIRVAAAVTQIAEEKYKVSLRSKVNYPIVNLAIQRGGGGHNNAAGYSINGYEIDVLDEVMRDCSLYAE